MIVGVRFPHPVGRCIIMAGKGRRAAARQGELSRRRKRTQRGPSGVPASRPQEQDGAAVASAVDTAEVTAVAAQAESQPEAAAATAVAQRPAPAAAPQRTQARVRGERPAAYNYVRAEIRRIAMLSTVVIAALVALSVVL